VKDSFQPVKLHRYDAAFRAEALGLVGESRSTQAAARPLNLNPKLLYEVTKISPYARGSSTRDGIEPRHGRRTGHHRLTTSFLGPATHPRPLVVYSDRGGQYGGNAYRVLLHQHGVIRSQSRRGDCYDNAQAESRWSRFKTEVLDLRE